MLSRITGAPLRYRDARGGRLARSRLQPFHSAYPFEAELAEQAKKAKVKNIYAEMGLLAGVMTQNPQRFAQCMGTLLDGLGADHIL